MSQVNGLPAHIVLVHAVVVLVPLAALAATAAAWWPALRRWLGVITPLLAIVAVAFVPVTTHAGEWLEAHVQHTDLVETHTELGDAVLPWAAGLAVLAIVGWLLGRHLDRNPGAGRRDVMLRIGLAVLTTAVAVGAVVTVIQAGESGARAAWDGRVSSAPVTGG